MWEIYRESRWNEWKISHCQWVNIKNEQWTWITHSQVHQPSIVTGNDESRERRYPESIACLSLRTWAVQIEGQGSAQSVLYL